MSNMNLWNLRLGFNLSDFSIVRENLIKLLSIIKIENAADPNANKENEAGTSTVMSGSDHGQPFQNHQMVRITLNVPMGFQVHLRMVIFFRQSREKSTGKIYWVERKFRRCNLIRISH